MFASRLLPTPFLALLLGALTVAGFAPFELHALPLISLIVLFRFWGEAADARRAAGLGFAWGLGFFLAGVSWVYVSLHDVGGMAAPLALIATVLFCAYLALFPAFAGGLFRWLRPRREGPWSAVPLVAACWLLAELMRGHLLTGFPWLAIGYSQTPPSPLSGFAPLIGSYGVGFVLALIAGAFAFAPAGWRGKAAALVFATLIVTAGALLGRIAWSEPVGEPLRVSLLQGNVPQGIKWDPKRLSLSLDTYLRLAEAHPAPLIVLPETALPLFLDQVPADVLARLAGQREALLGIAVRDGRGGYVNAGVALPLQDASPRLYAKRHLVPFGEFIPPGFDWFFALVRIPMSDFTPGSQDQRPIALAGQRVAVNICYEDLFGEELLAALPEASLLINLSNTAWFGRSLAQAQHLQAARLRALETGRPMLRATNTGMTAAIAADGRIIDVLPAFTAGALQVEVRGHQGLTPYARWANVPLWLLALALPCSVAARLWRRCRITPCRPG